MNKLDDKYINKYQFEKGKVMLSCKKCKTDFKYYPDNIPDKCQVCGGKLEQLKTVFSGIKFTNTV